MNHIVIDFEFTPIDKYYKHQRNIIKNEIIEFGAVKLNEQYQVVDEFSAFVKPEYSKKIDNYCSFLTGITDFDLSTAPTFAEVTELFLEWVGEDDYELYAWSEHDCKQFCGECKLKNMCERFSSMCQREWIDLQLIYIDVVGISKAISLERALNSLNILYFLI